MQWPVLTNNLTFRIVYLSHSLALVSVPVSVTESLDCCLCLCSLQASQKELIAEVWLKEGLFVLFA